MDTKKYKPNHDPEKIIPVRKDDDNDFTRVKPLVIDPSKPDPTVPRPHEEPDNPEKEEEEDNFKK